MNVDRNVSHNQHLDWHKSSYSGSGGGDCIEVAVSPDAVHVRDSKDVARTPFSVEADSWSHFVGFVAQA